MGWKEATASKSTTPIATRLSFIASTGSLVGDRQNGIRVRPDHIHTAPRELAGVADHAFSRRFPLGVADNEHLRGLWA
jgi:hypothetical protein